MARVMAMEGGANVVLFARNQDELETAKRDIQRVAAGKILYHVGDISKRDDIEDLVKRVNEELGGEST